MKVLYFDCFAGISGDMTLGALLDLGINKEVFLGEISKLNVSGYHFEFSRTEKNGIGANKVDVVLDEVGGKLQLSKDKNIGLKKNGFRVNGDLRKNVTVGKVKVNSHEHLHRNFFDIVKIIEDSHISDGAKKMAVRIFRRVAEAEAIVHQKKVEDVHFHEVGAVDSIVDIVGTAICLDLLKPDRVYCSVVNDGHGFVKCQHGLIPVPAPATLEILRAGNASFKQIDVEGELITPTGAAIISEISAGFRGIPVIKVEKIGYGAGTKNFSIPNVLRVSLGEMEEDGSLDEAVMLETNLDDLSPEVLGFVMERLFESGAKDVFFTPIQMKKNRPATKLSVLCSYENIRIMEDIIFSETTTLGIRRYGVERTILPYKKGSLNTKYGQLDTKISVYKGVERISVEYESAKRLALNNGVALAEIYDLIK